MSLSETFVRARSRYFPDHMIGEILTKRWSDNAVPFAALLLAVIVFCLIVEPHGLAQLWRVAKEKLRLWPFPH